MEAKELRIGNYGKEITHSTNRVVRVKKDHFEDMVRGEIDLFPIPLTEEWLVKFGFELEDEKIYYHLDSYEDIYITKTSYSFSIYNATHFTNIKQGIKHVHQLQNLYFALTNEELTIK